MEPIAVKRIIKCIFQRRDQSKCKEGIHDHCEGCKKSRDGPAGQHESEDAGIVQHKKCQYPAENCFCTAPDKSRGHTLAHSSYCDGQDAADQIWNKHDQQAGQPGRPKQHCALYRQGMKEISLLPGVDVAEACQGRKDRQYCNCSLEISHRTSVEQSGKIKDQIRGTFCVGTEVQHSIYGHQEKEDSA